MVSERTCDYTGEDIEPGTGKMYVQTDGTILWFKDSKAEKNYFLGREARDLEWTGGDEPDEKAADEPEDDETESEASADDESDEPETESEPADEPDEETEAEA
jgi:large subunit ribosomal protein L24e